MTPTPSPEVLQQVTEASSSGLEPAVIASLITGGVAIAVAVIGNLWSWYIARKTLADSQEFERERLDRLIASERERHDADLVEKRTDRVFNTKLNTATELIEALNYLATRETKVINGAIISQYSEKVRTLLPRASFLFSTVTAPKGLIQAVDELDKTTTERDNKGAEWVQTLNQLELEASMTDDYIGNVYHPHLGPQGRGFINAEDERFKKVIDDLEQKITALKKSIKSDTENLTQALRNELETITAPTEVEES